MVLGIGEYWVTQYSRGLTNANSIIKKSEDFLLLPSLSFGRLTIKRYTTFFSPRRFERAIVFGEDQTRSDAWPCDVLCSEHEILAKKKEAALQNVIGEPACLCGEITMCHSIGDGTKY